MRQTYVRGIDDGVRFDLGGDVGIICDVMEMGTAEYDLIYKVVLSGAELIEFLKKHRCAEADDPAIVPTNRYEITATDD